MLNRITTVIAANNKYFAPIILMILLSCALVSFGPSLVGSIFGIGDLVVFPTTNNVYVVSVHPSSPLPPTNDTGLNLWTVQNGGNVDILNASFTLPDGQKVVIPTLHKRSRSDIDDSLISIALCKGNKQCFVFPPYRD